MLAMQRSSWVHSAGFTTSVETDENGREVSEADVKTDPASKLNSVEDQEA